jgi:hypothetical protein
VKADPATRRYRERHIEANLPAAPPGTGRWQHVLVIPAYRESAEILRALRELARHVDRLLAIIVLNRPDSDPDREANQVLRSAARALPGVGGALYRLGDNSTVLLYDTESTRGPLPADRGVGLARKLGCDIAWQWVDQGAIASRWIHCTDADAILPPDYFQRTRGMGPGVAAATYPFIHTPGRDPACNRATALYELRLHHYVQGLNYAGSPYDYHSLGSCLAVTVDAYARVRGFPPRAAGEDFYLLNKLAKVGTIERLQGDCIELESRASHRVPFGTGPAVNRIRQSEASAAVFYHPLGFHALRTLLQVIATYYRRSDPDLAPILCASGLGPDLAAACGQTLVAMGLPSALDHCRRQSSSEKQFRRQFHQWFDAFRTLKFIHGLRDRCLPQQTLAALEGLEPYLWPDRTGADLLPELIRSRLGWTRRDPARW